MPPEENKTKHQKMTRNENSHEEGVMQGHNGNVRTNVGIPPRDQQGPRPRPRAAWKVERTRDTPAEARTRRGAQIRAAEDGGWRVVKKYRWTRIHTGRGCGERVRESGEATLKDTGEGAVGGGGILLSIKRLIQVGRVD